MNFFLYAYSYTQTGGGKVTVRQRAMNGMEGREGEGETKCASAGNRTRVTSMATMYSTTKPLMHYINRSNLFVYLIYQYLYSIFNKKIIYTSRFVRVILAQGPC